MSMYNDYKIVWLITTTTGKTLRRVFRVEATCLDDAIADAEQMAQIKYPDNELLLESADLES